MQASGRTDGRELLNTEANEATGGKQRDFADICLIGTSATVYFVSGTATVCQCWPICSPIATCCAGVSLHHLLEGRQLHATHFAAGCDQLLLSCQEG